MSVGTLRAGRSADATHSTATTTRALAKARCRRVRCEEVRVRHVNIREGESLAWSGRSRIRVSAMGADQQPQHIAARRCAVFMAMQKRWIFTKRNVPRADVDTATFGGMDVYLRITFACCQPCRAWRPLMRGFLGAGLGAIPYGRCLAPRHGWLVRRIVAGWWSGASSRRRGMRGDGGRVRLRLDGLLSRNRPRYAVRSPYGHP